MIWAFHVFRSVSRSDFSHFCIDLTSTEILKENQKPPKGFPDVANQSNIDQAVNSRDLPLWTLLDYEKSIKHSETTLVSAKENHNHVKGQGDSQEGCALQDRTVWLTGYISARFSPGTATHRHSQTLWTYVGSCAANACVSASVPPCLAQMETALFVVSPPRSAEMLTDSLRGWERSGASQTQALGRFWEKHTQIWVGGISNYIFLKTATWLLIITALVLEQSNSLIDTQLQIHLTWGDAPGPRKKKSQNGPGISERRQAP